MKAVFALGMLAPPSPPTLWFVGMIVLFYIATPALWLTYAATGFPDPRLPLFLPAYAAGLLFARCEPLHIPALGWPGLGVLVAIAAMVTAPASAADPVEMWMAPFALIASVSVFLCLNHRLPRIGVVAWLSYGSFFLYLLPRPIYDVVVKVAPVNDGSVRVGLLVGLAFPVAILAGYAGQLWYDRMVVARLRQDHPPGTSAMTAPGLRKQSP